MEADAVRLMQKALDLMNLHLHKAISDISGVTGLRIIRAIVDGVHDPCILADMKEKRIRCSHDELVHALTGNYRMEHLFALRLALAQYDFTQQQIQECDVVLAEYLSTITDEPTSQVQSDTEPSDQSLANVRIRRQRIRGNAPSVFSLPREIERLTGRRWDCIPGIGAMTIMTGISEVGLDLSRWPSERHFSSWLGLCPNRKVTGGRLISSHTRKVNNRFATSLRMAASALSNSKSALGAEFSRLRARLGPAKAITAMAHKLACLYYRLMRYGQVYVDTGQVEYEAKSRERTIKYLQKRASGLGLQLIQTSSVTD
ncbi:MAG: transposase [Coriobacteriia bacterium]